MVAPALERAPLLERAGLAAAGGCGAAVALQARVNGELAGSLGDALLAAAVSFAVGLAAVAALLALRPGSRAALPRVRRTRAWERLGGLGGATLIAVNAAAAPVVGVALLTVAYVAGQTGGALAVDRVGLGPGGRRPVTLPRVAGSGLALVAVAVAVLGRGTGAARPLLLALVVLTGVAAALQQALNARVQVATGDPYVATLVNFAVGGTALAAVLAVHVALAGLGPVTWPGADRWYLYLGGPLGVTFVAVAAVVVRSLGVLRFGLAVIAGQLLGALLLDLALPVAGVRVGPGTVVGVALTLVAVAVAGAGVRR